MPTECFSVFTIMNSPKTKLLVLVSSNPRPIPQRLILVGLGVKHFPIPSVPLGSGGGRFEVSSRAVVMRHSSVMRPRQGTRPSLPEPQTRGIITIATNTIIFFVCCHDRHQVVLTFLFFRMAKVILFMKECELIHQIMVNVPLICLTDRERIWDEVRTAQGGRS